MYKLIKLKDLKDAHKGRPALVLGGGPSLLPDVERASALLHESPVLVAVNHHAVMTGLEPFYMVFMDDPIHLPNLFQVAKDFGGIKLSPLLEYTDVDMRGVNYWNGPCTDKVASWLALFMGCDPVVLCGMDLYQGDVKYSHPGEPNFKPIYNIELEEHIRRWKRGFVPGVCPGIERLRAASGPLVDVFGTC